MSWKGMALAYQTFITGASFSVSWIDEGYGWKTRLRCISDTVQETSAAASWCCEIRRVATRNKIPVNSNLSMFCAPQAAAPESVWQNDTEAGGIQEAVKSNEPAFVAFLTKARTMAFKYTALARTNSCDGKNLQHFREREWFYLLQDVGNSKLPTFQKSELILQLLDIMYKSFLTVNSRHVSAAITVCLDAGSLTAAHTIVEDALARGNELAVTPHIIAKLIQSYCASNQRKHAFALLSEMLTLGLKPDVVIYNILLESEQNPEGVSLLMQEMKKLAINADERSYSAAIRCYGRAGLMDSVRQTWNAMIASAVSPSEFTFNSLIDAYANVGDVEACKQIFNEMEMRKMLNLSSYNTLIKAYARSRNSDGAYSLLRAMLLQGVEPCIRTYNSVMDACVRGGNMHRALSLLKEIHSRGLRPDATTFATMLRAAGFLRDTKMVQTVLMEMRSAACMPDAALYRSAVYAYVHCGEGGAALEILEKMRADGFTPAMTVQEVLIKSVDAALLRECTIAALGGRLHQFLADTTMSGLKPTPGTGSGIVRKLIYSHGVNLALDVAKELLQAGISPLGLHTWKLACRACATCAVPSKAGECVNYLLNLMAYEGTTPDREIHEAAISVYVKCGDGERALAMYEKLKKLNCTLGNEAQSQSLLDRMLLETMDAALCVALAADVVGLQEHKSNRDSQHGNHKVNTNIIQDMALAGIRLKPRGVTQIIRQLCSDDSAPSTDTSKYLVATGILRKPKPVKHESPVCADLNLQTEKLLRLERAMELVETATCLFGMQTTTFVYEALMDASVKLQQVEKVELLWKRMREDNVKPDEATWLLRIRAMTLSKALYGCAHELLAEASSEGLEVYPHLLRALLKGCRKIGDSSGYDHCQQIIHAKLSATIESRHRGAPPQEILVHKD
ncbi:hypothetical protein O6H91_Y026800 [Diphasiastrum complanatum]|nr:hypothetical protein O6H91_Y026800 [Diphasiastrum complanatum]